MKDQYLSEIITHLEQNTSKENGYFELCEEDEGYMIYIKGNNDGLKLFATELLKAAAEIEKSESIPNKIKLNINENEEWFEGFPIEYVKQANRDTKPNNYEQTFSDKMKGFGCVVIGIIVLTAMFIGFKTMFNWLF